MTMHALDIGRTIRSVAVVAGITAAMTAGMTSAGITSMDALTTRNARAQDAAHVDYSGHPMVGTWMASTPGGPALSTFAADGSVVMGVQPTASGPQGVTFASAEVGTWESTGERSAHFTAVQILSDAEGSLTGTLTIDGFPVVSEDGQSLRDDGTQATFTVRNAAGGVIDSTVGGPPVTAIRMAVGQPGFAEEGVEGATPGASASVVGEDLIRATEEERLRALVDADVTRADQLHTDDFQLINPAGSALSKEEYLGGIASGDIDYLVFEPSTPIVVRLYGDTAIIRYQSRIHILVGGEDITTSGWHTDLYELRDGRWQAVWSQMTEIA